ncbi:hypothetical protein EDB87DRAFT_1316834 [Lactarius vividus]|nr:hypothetical protein EDB87DRAFT_1316834 [Lactarius vividus]
MESAVPSPSRLLPTSDRVIPALSPVHWYTQHLSHSAPLPSHRTVHVLYHRLGRRRTDMLLTPPATLARYDIPTPTLDVLRCRAPRSNYWPARALAGELRMLTALDAIPSPEAHAATAEHFPAPDSDPSRAKSWSLAHGPRHRTRASPPSAYTDAHVHRGRRFCACRTDRHDVRLAH